MNGNHSTTSLMMMTLGSLMENKSRIFISIPWENIFSNMCKDCVFEEKPNRGRTCIDGGCYFLNLRGCCVCKRVTTVKQAEMVLKTGDDSDNEYDEDTEVTSFFHVCTECGHQIAKHSHMFNVDDGFQYYNMNCLLCGRASDTISVSPEDPRISGKTMANEERPADENENGDDEELKEEIIRAVEEAKDEIEKSESAAE